MAPCARNIFGRLRMPRERAPLQTGSDMCPRIWVQCLVLGSLAAIAASGGEDASLEGDEETSRVQARPRLREFAFVSRPQDRRKGGSGACQDGGEAQFWREHGVQLLSEGQAYNALRCLKMALRLGCNAAHVFQDMSMARLGMKDIDGALQDSRHAIKRAGCSLTPDVNSGGAGPQCTNPQLLLNYASLLDKALPSHTTLSRIQQVLRQYIRASCRKDDSGSLACSARGAIGAIVELWRLGQLSFGNWDTWQEDKWLLIAAVAADVSRCVRENDHPKPAVGQEELAPFSTRYSVVQPWEASMFPLPPELVAHITSLRSLSLSLMPAHTALSAAPAIQVGEALRVGIVVHKLSGLLTGLLRHVLTSRDESGTRRGQRRPPAAIVLVAWEVPAGAAGEDKSSAFSEARESIGGIDEAVGIGGLSPHAAARRVNAAGLHVAVDVMGWIPEGRQVPTLEMLSLRPCAVQVTKEVHSTSGSRFIDYILADRVAVPPESSALYVEALLALPPSFLPNSHSSNYPLNRLGEAEHACEWGSDQVALLGLYEHYKLDPFLLHRWLAVVKESRAEEARAHESPQHSSSHYNNSQPDSLLPPSPNGGARAVLVLQEGAYPALTTPVLLRVAAQWGLRVRRGGRAAAAAAGAGAGGGGEGGGDEGLLLLAWAKGPAEYIARMGCGRSVLVDAGHYSAHTVAVDALWAGSLLLTLGGERLVSRVPVSLLYGIGMHKQLIARTWDEYSALLTLLIRRPQKIASLQRRVRHARHTADMYTRHFFKEQLLRAATLAFDACVSLSELSAAQTLAGAREFKVPHIMLSV